MTIAQVRQAIDNRKARSAWRRGVKQYAHELLDNYYGSASSGCDLNAEYIHDPETLLNGARNWFEYSHGGCSLIYDEDIAELLCTPSELKRKRGGELRPNRNEAWLDVQARALKQAEYMLRRISKG